MTPEERAIKIAQKQWDSIFPEAIKQIREAVAEERERCAKVAEKDYPCHSEAHDIRWCEHCSVIEIVQEEIADEIRGLK